MASTKKKSSYHHGDLKNALIAAGADVLAREGVAALSLRRVAQKAGVSHAAPYAHFADKQALIAAISSEGFRRLYDALGECARKYAREPVRLLVESAWVYVQFALESPDQFKVTMSGVLEREKDYPEFVALSHQTFERLVAITAACQQGGVLRDGPPELMAVSTWGAVHGMVSLLLEQQLPSTVRERYSPAEILLFILSQQALVPLEPPSQVPKQKR
jgi:AcrR family transcriptional regulator